MRFDSTVHHRKNVANGNVGKGGQVSNGYYKSTANGGSPPIHKPLPQLTKTTTIVQPNKLEHTTPDINKNDIVKSTTKSRPSSPSTSKFYDDNSPPVEDIPLSVAFFTFLSYGVLLLVGYVKNFFKLVETEKDREDYVPLFVGFETFYFHYVYRPIRDCFDNPICSAPGEHVTIMERTSDDYNWTINLTGKRKRSINIGSYNYLGFAETEGPCHDEAQRATIESGVSVASSRNEIGNLKIHEELEALTAEFLGVDDAITFGMGFATNSLNLPSLLGPGCLVLSDENNHASLILGLRLSGASVKVFRHNNCADLERRLQRAIIEGHPRTRRPWKKALIVVEGIYSMEGTICNLPRIIEIKKKYKAYLYIDEAHSVGALGPNGRGVVDYYNCNPRDVDILMGTYTKSFAAAGGYIAGSKELIQHLRIHSDAQHYAAAIAPPVAQQIITSMTIIMGKDGTDDGQRRVSTLRRNTRYLRDKLRQSGFVIGGCEDSPVLPVLAITQAQLCYIQRELRKRGIAIVVVGFPATKITGSRMRFCLSASHSKESLDTILKEVNELGDLVGCKYDLDKVDPNVTIEW